MIKNKIVYIQKSINIKNKRGIAKRITFSELAKMFNVSRQTIKRKIKKLNCNTLDDLIIYYFKNYVFSK